MFGEVQASVLHFSITLFCAHAKIGARRTTAVTYLQQKKSSERLFVYLCMLFALNRSCYIFARLEQRYNLTMTLYAALRRAVFAKGFRAALCFLVYLDQSNIEALP